MYLPHSRPFDTSQTAAHQHAAPPRASPDSSRARREGLFWPLVGGRVGWSGHGSYDTNKPPRPKASEAHHTSALVASEPCDVYDAIGDVPTKVTTKQLARPVCLRSRPKGRGMSRPSSQEAVSLSLTWVAAHPSLAAGSRLRPRFGGGRGTGRVPSGRR